MSTRTFRVPPDQRYFEDYVQGAVFEFGPIAVTESDIVQFARSFDPQAMHTDRDAARQGPFGGLIASGWHTISLLNRLFIDHYLTSTASLASPGVDEVRWMKPVRPGDQLRLRIEVIGARRSRTKTDRGLVHSKAEGINQDGDVVVSFLAMNLIGLRPSSAEG